MKLAFRSLRIVISVIAMLMAGAGLALTFLAALDLVYAFGHVSDLEQSKMVGAMAIGLLRAVDLFLIAIVFFVMSIGLLVLFHTEATFPIRLPEWLRIKNFMELKVILWEAILTTLVVSYLAGLVGSRVREEPIHLDSLLIPGGILLISLSLFFLKKGEK